MMASRAIIYLTLIGLRPPMPATEEMVELLLAATLILRPEQLWVNPDCGLKTRTWEEVEGALTNMVAAAAHCRD